jgi:hypothetical protein
MMERRSFLKSAAVAPLVAAKPFPRSPLPYQSDSGATPGGLELHEQSLVFESYGFSPRAALNRVGVIVDVAHSGWKTGLDGARVSTRPIVASHTVCDGLNNHIRAKPDNLLRAIAETGGLAGICCIPAFLGGSGDIAAMLDHIAYAAKRVGADHVAIGTDVAYISRYIEGQGASCPEAAPRDPAGKTPGRPTRFPARKSPEPRLDELAALHSRNGSTGPERRRHPEDPGREHAARCPCRPPVVGAVTRATFRPQPKSNRGDWQRSGIKSDLEMPFRMNRLSGFAGRKMLSGSIFKVTFAF